jgi:hypothetical protein
MRQEWFGVAKNDTKNIQKYDFAPSASTELV